MYQFPDRSTASKIYRVIFIQSIYGSNFHYRLSVNFSKIFPRCFWVITYRVLFTLFFLLIFIKYGSHDGECEQRCDRHDVFRMHRQCAVLQLTLDGLLGVLSDNAGTKNSSRMLIVNLRCGKTLPRPLRASSTVYSSGQAHHHRSRPNPTRRGPTSPWLEAHHRRAQGWPAQELRQRCGRSTIC